MNEQLHLEIGSVLSNSWQLIRGIKLAIWLVMIAAAIVIMIIDSLFIGATGETWKKETYWASHIFIPLLNAIFLAPFIAGAILISAKRARQEPITKLTGFQYFHRYISLAITLLITTLITNLFTIITNHPRVPHFIFSHQRWFDFLGMIYSLFTSSFLILALPLVAEKRFNPLVAIRQSIRLVVPCWVKVVVLLLICAIFLFIAFMPLIIGLILQNLTVLLICLAVTIGLLIWLLPFVFLVTGNIYHRLTDIPTPTAS